MILLLKLQETTCISNAKVNLKISYKGDLGYVIGLYLNILLSEKMMMYTVYWTWYIIRKKLQLYSNEAHFDSAGGVPFLSEVNDNLFKRTREP